MGIVHREDGFAFRIWPNDHEPPHVHARKGGASATIRISSREVVKVSRTMKGSDVVRAVRIVAANEQFLLREWKRIHERADRR